MTKLLLFSQLLTLLAGTLPTSVKSRAGDIALGASNTTGDEYVLHRSELLFDGGNLTAQLPHWNNIGKSSHTLRYPRHSCLSRVHRL